MVRAIQYFYMVRVLMKLRCYTCKKRTVCL